MTSIDRARAALIALALLVSLPARADTAAKLRAQEHIWAAGQSRWTLLPRKLINRNLKEQLAEDPHRLGADLPYVTLAADASAGAELARRREDLTRYHGFFIVDTFAEVTTSVGFTLNLNLTALNPSASDGYRYSSQVLPGAALHLHYELDWFGGAPLELELVAPDLDITTIGQGLLVEEVPLEGFGVGIARGGIEWRTLFGGRIFWPDDDIIHSSLTILDGELGVGWTRWLLEGERPLLAYNLVGMSPAARAAAYLTGLPTDYFTAFYELVPADFLHFAIEYGVSLRRNTRVRHAGLMRVDFLGLALGPVDLHAGYQFRYYDQAFGPRERRLATSSTAPNTPYREDTYVTNSYEYLALSSGFRQWSHTAMLEAEVRLGGHVALYGEGELWQRYIVAIERASPVIYVPRFGRAPGSSTQIFYRGGVRIMPWEMLPHRLSASVTNKRVASAMYAQDPVSKRFVGAAVLTLEVEVFL